MSGKRFNPFGDEPRDRQNMIIWLIKQLNTLSRKTNDAQKQSEIDSLIDQLEELENYLADRSELPASSYSDDFYDKIIPVWHEASEMHQEPLIWGTWRSEKRRHLNHGYSDSHDLTVIRKKSATSTHYYSEIPEPLKWKCIPITQKKTTFYIIIGKVSELDAVCSVPSFAKTLETSESGLRVLDRKREPKQWQRNPQPSRIAAIETFIDDEQNIVANTPLIFAPESKHVTYTKDNKGIIKEVIINFDFLIKDGDQFCDHKEMDDCRPLWLIDGQHRVRGISQNKISTELDIPFVFFPEKLGMVAAAKIFAEVNTLAQDLSDLHKIFMRHRFEIQSHDRESDFRPIDETRPETHNSRRNTLSYECAGFLTSAQGSPLKSLIKILDENKDSNHIIDAKMFLKHSVQWFDKNGAYPPTTDLTKEEIFQEVKDYFLALESVVNHYTFDGTDEAWPDERQRWERVPPRQGRSALQETRNFRAILRLLPVAVEMGSGLDRPITKRNFEKILMPLSWVDWQDQDLKEIYVKKTGEFVWKQLLIWMENAIVNGEVFDRTKVMSKTIQSMHGQGILARPETPILYLEEDSPKWPTTEKPVVLLSRRPVNSDITSKWYIRDAKGNPRNQRVNIRANMDGSCRYEIKYETWMNANQPVGQSMEIRVDWANAVGESSERLELKNEGNE